MTARPDAAALLAAVPLLAGLSDDALATLARAATSRRYALGQVLFQAGDPGDSLLVIAAGRVQVSVRSADGAELILQVLGAGAVIGELSVVDGGCRSAGASTLAPTELLRLPRAAVLELLRVHPEVAARMLQSLAAGMRRLTEVTADLVFLDLPRRLAKLLLEQPRTTAASVELGLNQTQLAARIGGTRQSVNGALRAFERRGWIAVEGHTLRLTHVAAMARFAGVDPEEPR